MIQFSGMKCISLWQPWASLVAIGAKRIETRSWSTRYRCPLAIHAAKYYSMNTADYASSSPCADVLRIAGLEWGRLPFGGIVAVAYLFDVAPTASVDSYRLSPALHEKEFGDYRPGRFAFLLGNIKPLKQMIPYRAHQGLFNLDADVISQVWRAAA